MASARCELLCLDLNKAEALRRRRLPGEQAAAGALRAKALSEPTRLTLAAALAETDELCACDLSWISERPDNLVSHHLGQLCSAGIARSRRKGEMILYSLTDAGRELLAATVTDSEAVD